MEIGIGIDQRARLSWDEQREVVRAAAQMGYTSAWTTAGSAPDAFFVCAHWSASTKDLLEGGLKTGIAVVPVPLWTAPSLASLAATTGDLTGGRHILGIGTGGSYTAAYRRRFGVEAHPPISQMRDWAIVLRGLLDGETVDYEGRVLSLHGVSLDFKAPRVPVYLGALGEQMLRLVGQVADGAALNWCTPEQIAWSRARIEEGARAAGRDPSQVKMAEYIRICVDDDVDLARRAYTRAVLNYAMAKTGANKTLGYRGHFARMGFDEALTELEEREARGAPESEIIDNFPDELLRLVGYYGPAAGAGPAFRRLAEGLDEAMVRLVPARPGAEAAIATFEACRP